MPILYVLSGPDIGRTFDVATGAVLGRTAECDVGLKGTAVSRKHARVEERPEGWYLVDLGSRNGIHLDGRRMAEFALADGGSFEVGDVELRFRIEDSGAQAAPLPRKREPEPQRAPELEPETEVELDEDHFSGEIQFEGEELFEQEPSRPAATAPGAPRPTPGPGGARTPAPGPGAAPQPARGKAAPSREAQRLAAAGIRARPGAESGRVHDGGRPVLQYARQSASSGPLGADLAQLPLWARVAAGLAAIALFVGLFYGAFVLTGSLKERSFGDAETELVDDAADSE